MVLGILWGKGICNQIIWGLSKDKVASLFFIAELLQILLCQDAL